MSLAQTSLDRTSALGPARLAFPVASPLAAIRAWAARLAHVDPWVLGFALGFAALAGCIQGARLWTFTYLHATQDQALFLQLMHSLWHEHRFAESIYHSTRFLGQQHFAPIYALLAPLAAIVPPRVLIGTFPIAAIVAAALVAYRIVLRHGGERLLGRAVVAALLFNPLSIRLANQGIRETVIAALLLALAIDAFERRRRTAFAVACLLAAGCKEDIPLVVAGFVLPALLERRRGFWLGFPLLAGVGGFALITEVVMPHFGATPGQGGLGFPWFRALGRSYGEVAMHVLAHPLATLARILAAGDAGDFFLRYLAGVGFLPLLAPGYLLVPASQYLEIALASAPHVSSISNWYWAPAYPFAAAALARAALRLDCWVARRASVSTALTPLGARRAVPFAVATLTALNVGGAAWTVLAEPRCFEGARITSEHGTEGGLLDAAYVASYFRFHRTWSRQIERLFARIPADAAVSAQYPFLLAFAGRSALTLFPDARDASWVVMAPAFPRAPPLPDRELTRTLARLRSNGFRRVAQWGGVSVLERGGLEEAQLDRCLTDCQRREAEQLPSGAARAVTAHGTCLARNRIDPAASGSAVRASWWGSPIPVRWTSDLAPGRYKLRLRVAAAPGAMESAPTGYAVRLLVRDAYTGTVLTERSYAAADLPGQGAYRVVSMRFDIVGTGAGGSAAGTQRMHMEVEDPGNVPLRLDWLEIRGRPFRTSSAGQEHVNDHEHDRAQNDRRRDERKLRPHLRAIAEKRDAQGDPPLERAHDADDTTKRGRVRRGYQALEGDADEDQRGQVVGVSAGIESFHAQPPALVATLTQ